MQHDILSPRRYRLRGQLLGNERTFFLTPGEHQVGSTDANDVILPAAGVSRCHAWLEYHAELSGQARFWVRDGESSNGTFVNDERVAKQQVDVHLGDVLRFGPVELRLEEMEAGDTELALVLPSVRRPTTALPSDETTARYRGPSKNDPLPTGLLLPAGCVAGRSPAMAQLYRTMQASLSADLPVLIEGETGVGKESVARALHLSSSRREKPFIAINCAAIPADLLEAELFGIGEGVATGVKKRPGKFRAAEGGTLLLDELAEMPLELQAKLLRVLQEKEVQPLGDEPVAVDVWILAATNLDLLERVLEGGFRRDLYYRVAGYVLEVPALRKRPEDIPLFIEHFLKQSAAAKTRSILGVTVRCLDALVRYAWPGNVRELEHEVRRLVHLCAEGQAIESSLLSKHVAAVPSAALDASRPETNDEPLRLETHVRETERRLILEALKQAGGSRRKAARLLGIARSTLLRKIDNLAIST